MRPFTFTEDDLRTVEGRRNFYHYWDDVPESFVEKKAPRLLESSIEEINRELELIAGKDIHGDPRWRASWAGTLPEIKYDEDNDGKTHEFFGKKYAQCRRWMIDGYEYINKKGHRQFARTVNQVPKGKVCQILRHRYELGELFWVVEFKYTADEMVRAGYLPPPDSERAKTFCIRNGQRYRKPFDPKGEYVLAFKCQEFIYPTNMSIPIGFYRDITMKDVEKVKETWAKAQSESDNEFTRRIIERRKKLDELQEYNDMMDRKVSIQDSSDRINRIRDMAGRISKVQKGRLI